MINSISYRFSNLRCNFKIGKLLALYEKNIKSKKRLNKYFQELHDEDNIAVLQHKAVEVTESDAPEKYKNVYSALNQINTYMSKLSALKKQDINKIRTYFYQIKRQISLPSYTRYFLIRNTYVNKMIILLLLLIILVATIVVLWQNGVIQSYFQPAKDMIGDIL